MFLINWQGRIVTPLRAPVNAVNTGRDLIGLAGVFTGTYEVVDATGKYKGLLGRKFPCKGMASNVVRGTLQPFGGSYTEVYEDTPSTP
jgi:hypothetical protein